MSLSVRDEQLQRLQDLAIAVRHQQRRRAGNGSRDKPDDALHDEAAHGQNNEHFHAVVAVPQNREGRRERWRRQLDKGNETA